MHNNAETLVAEYRATGTLAGLPEGHFIQGQYRGGHAGRTMDSTDPGTARSFARFAAGDADDVDSAVRGADRAYREVWRKVVPVERGRILQRAAQAVLAQADRLAVVETIDNGKTLAEARADMRSTARVLEYYAGVADKLQGESIPLGPDYLAFTTLEPVGVTAHVIPWNYPASTMVRGIAPALAAGCTAVVKPAEQTPMTALLLAQILRDAGLPDGVCNVVTGTGSAVGAPLVEHPLVRHITFTGSVATGSRVMQAAARHIASVTLELGGKSPAVVLADCDIDKTVQDVLWGIFYNAGQTCSAGSRLVIERAIHAQFVERLATHAAALRCGHGLRGFDIGAITTREQLDKIAAFVDGAKARGARVACGGSRVVDPESGLGWFFPPTILDGVAADDAVVQQEIFGPVLAVQVADSPEAALALANGTEFGLAAGIYTRDITRALRLARDIDAGQVYVNEYYAGGVETPFGGTKQSGFGREKGLEGLRSYVRTKCTTVRI
jgi:acyl-CoA reductase-like NAD-dependent aldehyde dehydrogenase